ncbi:MAG TPA: hypothetical protein VIV60_07870 [Polyangiaceae bacterium]
MPNSDHSSRGTRKALTRRDATGHINPRYERELLEQSRATEDDRDSPDAFLQRPRTGEALSEEFGEAFVESVTSGEDAEAERKEQVLPEEQGGPFLTTNADEEFADGTDASNIEEATREPLPKTSSADPLSR